MSIFRPKKPERIGARLPDPRDMALEANEVGRMKIDPEKCLTIKGQRLRGVDFSGRKLKCFASANSSFDHCRFENMRTEATTLGGAFTDCSFDGSRLVLGVGDIARFVRCSFRDVDFYHWFCFSVEMIDCTFSGRMRKAVFNGEVPAENKERVGRRRNEFHGNDFSAMRLIDVGFRTGIDLTKQRLPTGPEYAYVPRAAETLEEARKSVVHWPDMELRRAVLKILEVLDSETAGGQQQLLVRPADFGALRKQDGAIDAMFALLREG